MLEELRFYLLFSSLLWGCLAFSNLRRHSESGRKLCYCALASTDSFAESTSCLQHVASAAVHDSAPQHFLAGDLLVVERQITSCVLQQWQQRASGLAGEVNEAEA